MACWNDIHEPGCSGDKAPRFHITYVSVNAVRLGGLERGRPVGSAFEPFADFSPHSTRDVPEARERQPKHFVCSLVTIDCGRRIPRQDQTD